MGRRSIFFNIVNKLYFNEFLKKKKQKIIQEFLLWRIGDKSDWCLRGPLALLSGLRIQHCLELWCRSQTQLGSYVAAAVV